MLKIVANVNKQDVVSSYTVGQAFPKIEGKLVSVELSGKELAALQRTRDLPVSTIDNACLSWHGRHAGRILKELRELFDT